MSELKRVTVTSVPANDSEKKRPKKKRTVRLVLTLSESNEKTCPEFSYGDLLSKHLSRRLGNHRIGDVINGPAREKGDPYASDEEEALKALARSFEKKYGGGTVGGPRRKKRKKENDFKQLGEGYDETDPFIDNSDAIDDVLPTNVETKFGGFYINSGELNFEEVQLSEDEKSNDSQIQNHKRKRKNEVISSEEEEEKEEEGKVIEERRETDDNDDEEVKKRKLDEGEILRKRKKMIDKFNAKKHQPKEEDQEKENDAKVKEISEATERSEQKVNGDTSIAASIEAVVSKARESANLQEETPFEDSNRKEKENEEEEEDEEDGEEKEESSSESSSSSSSSDSSSSDSESEDGKEDKESGKETEKKEEEEMIENEEAAVSNDNEHDHIQNSADDNERDSALPADLPQDLIVVLDKLKEIGKNSKASSQRFFTDAVNKYLLSIEIKICKYPGRKKNLIYNHLSQNLPCGTQTLVKRSKNLLVEKLDERLRAPTQRLKEALDKIMPKLLEEHALECQKLAEGKTKEEENEEAENQSESDNSKLPKKRFEFTPEIRELLCDIVKIRCQGWHMVKKRSETAEDHVKTFIDSKLKSIWPKGWINTKILYKESQSAHSLITEKNNKKSTTAPKKETILGGGTVSNANLTSILKLSTDTAIASTDLVNGDAKLGVPSKDTEKSQESKPKYSSLDNKESTPGDCGNKNGTNNKLTCSQELKDKSSPSQKENLNPTISVDSTPTKDFIRTNSDLSSISPISESSQKSFHGFESPNKVSDVRKGEEISPKQSSLDTKKPTKLDFNSSLQSLPPVREGKPPKPSLTATALPKVSVAHSISIAKGESLKKGFGDNLDVPKTTKEDKKVTCISIKSVEKINEAVGSNSKDYKDGSKKVESRAKEPPKENSRHGELVSIIKLETCNESTQIKEDLGNVQTAPSVISARSVSVISSRASIKSSNGAHSIASGEASKYNKLEQEMDQVMNEILHISKKNMKSNEHEEKDHKQETSLAVSRILNLSCSAEKQKLSLNQSKQPKISPILSPQNNVSKILNLSSYDTAKQKNTALMSAHIAVIKERQADFVQPTQKPEIISKHQSSHSNNPPSISSKNIQRTSPIVSPTHNLQHINHHSTSNTKTTENTFTYQNSHTSHSKPKQDFYNRAMHSGLLDQSKTLDRPTVEKGSRSSNQTTTLVQSSEVKSSHSSNTAVLQLRNDKGPLDMHKPAAHSDSSTSSSIAGNNCNISSQGAGQHKHTSLSSYNGNYKTPTSNYSGNRHSVVSASNENQDVTASVYSGNHRISPSSPRETIRTSSYNEVQRTSPSTPKNLSVFSQGEIHRKSSTCSESGQHSPSYGESHRMSPNHSGSHHRVSPSNVSGVQRMSPSNSSGGHRISPSNFSGSRRISPSHSSGDHRISPSKSDGGHRMSPSNHRRYSSSHSGNHRTSPSTHSSSHRTSSSSTHSVSYRTSPSTLNSNHQASPPSHGSSHRISPTRIRESSSSRTTSSLLCAGQLPSFRRTPPLITSVPQSHKMHNVEQRISHNGDQHQASLSALQGGSYTRQAIQRNNDLTLSKENISATRDYGITSLSESKSLQQPGQSTSHSLSHSSSRSSRPGSDTNLSNYTHHAVPPRSSKPSHNIEGLLYNNSSSSSSKNTPVNLSHSSYSHINSQSSASKSQSKHPQLESSWSREANALNSPRPSSASRQKSADSMSYPSSGNGSFPLSNMRLIDLSVNRSAETSDVVALYATSENSGSSKQLGSLSSQRSSLSSVQPKVKQRNDTYPVSETHPTLGNITSEQHELWQPMNAGGNLSWLPPGEVYKYMQQQDLYQNSSSSESSNRKSGPI